MTDRDNAAPQDGLWAIKDGRGRLHPWTMGDSKRDAGRKAVARLGFSEIHLGVLGYRAVRVRLVEEEEQSDAH